MEPRIIDNQNSEAQQNTKVSATNANNSDTQRSLEQIVIFRCPDCNSKKISIINGCYGHCDDCGCSFLLQTNQPHSKDVTQANILNLSEGNYKICPDCGNKMPIDAGQCSVCGYKTFGKSIEIAARNTARYIFIYVLFFAILALIILILINS